MLVKSNKAKTYNHTTHAIQLPLEKRTATLPQTTLVAFRGLEIIK